MSESVAVNETLPLVSILDVNGEQYQISDAKISESLANLIASLGALAYKNEAKGVFTPTGNVSTPTITVNTATKNIYQITGLGSLPSLTSSLSGETLKLSFTPGSLPTRAQVSVVSGISSASASAIKFTGIEKEVIVQ